MTKHLAGDRTFARSAHAIYLTWVGRGGRFALGALALAVSLIALGPDNAARAETLSISATGLVMRCPCATPNDIAVESHGVFKANNPNGRYFVPVVFPVTIGQRICSFTMVYQDINNADTIVARLIRKHYAVGANPFMAPTVLATLKSAPQVVSTTRKATTNSIKVPAIDATDAFYYIEADLVTTNLNLLGFQIEYKPKCP